MVIFVRTTWISLIPFLFLDAVAEIKPSVDSKADLQYKEIRKWTDVKGRTIEAAFMDIDGSNLYLEWNGKKATLPLSMFSENSLKLAKELKNLSPIVNLKYELFHGDWNRLPNWDELEGNQSASSKMASSPYPERIGKIGSGSPLPAISRSKRVDPMSSFSIPTMVPI